MKKLLLSACLLVGALQVQAEQVNINLSQTSLDATTCVYDDETQAITVTHNDGMEVIENIIVMKADEYLDPADVIEGLELTDDKTPAVAFIGTSEQEDGIYYYYIALN